MIRAILQIRLSLAALTAQFTAAYALRGPVTARCAGWCALTVAATARLGSAYALLPTTPVSGRLKSIHSAFDPAVEFAPEIAASVDGAAIELAACSISCNEDAYCLSCEIEVADAAAWTRCLPGAVLELRVGSQAFTFMIDSRSRARSFPAASYKASGRSPASRLEAPYAAPFSQAWTNVTARSVAQEICAAAGFSLDWRIADWPLASFAVEQQTPLAALATLKTEASLLLSDPAGGLLVQYRYPRSPTRYADAQPDIVFSDYDDIQRLDDTHEVKPGYNAVYVLDEQSELAQLVELQEWTGTPGADEAEDFPTLQRCVAAYTWPYLSIQLQTHCDCAIIPQGAAAFEYEETAPIVEGKGTLTFAPDAILSWIWLCAALGDVAASGKTVTAVIAGQSLLKIKYRVRCQRFLLESDAAQQAQVWAEIPESQAVGSASSPRLVRVTRWPGDREAPDVIIDPLCTTRASKIERGRNYLDSEGLSKERYEASTPARPLLLPGAIAAVHDASFGASFLAKVTGWKFQAQAGADGVASTFASVASVTWDLERSL